MAQHRKRLRRRRPLIIWLTGLSASGKSTIASALALRMENAIVLDGDELRRGLCADLGFSPADRAENVRRVSEVAALLVGARIPVIVAMISPYRAGRQRARNRAHPARFVEVFVGTSIEVCEARDPKGLYRKARNGEIKDFTGIDAPYEEPLSPEIRLDTYALTVEQCVGIIVDYLGSDA